MALKGGYAHSFFEKNNKSRANSSYNRQPAIRVSYTDQRFFINWTIAMELTLDCSKRADTEKPKALRREGVTPAVLYGHDGTNTISLKANTREVEALLRQAKGRKVEVTLNVADISWNGKAVLQEVQNHPWKSMVYHISFLAQQG